MGRKPCNNNGKDALNKGPWTEDEDLRLTQFIKAHGEGRWPALAKNAGLKRCGKSCRFRWVNYLRPNLKRGNISPDEEDLIIRLHKLLGNRWSLIAGRIPGRTDNEIKNYWNTRSNKKAHGNACIGRLKSVRPTEADVKEPAVQVTPTLDINNQSGERDEVIAYRVIPEVKKGSTSSNSINKDKTLMSPKHETLMSPKQNPSFCSNAGTVSAEMTLWNPLQLNFIISSSWANSNFLHIDHFNVNKAEGGYYDEKAPAPAPAPPGCCTSETVNICQDFIDQMYSVPHTSLPFPEAIPTIDEFADFFTASWHCIKE